MYETHLRLLRSSGVSEENKQIQPRQSDQQPQGHMFDSPQKVLEVKIVFMFLFSDVC